MRAVRYEGDSRLGIIEVADPTPGPDEVLVRVTASAICASERGSYASQQGAATNSGHEAVGVVANAGEAKRLKVGDRVATYPVCGCGDCAACLRLEFMKCAARRFMPPTHMEYVAFAERALIPLPDDLDDLAAVALFGCGIGVAYGGAAALGAAGARTVLVVGLGPIGLASVIVHRFLGAYVIGADLHLARLDFARRLGAHQVIDAGATDLVEAARGLTGGEGPDATIECSGHQSGFRAALSAVRVGGTMIALGGAQGNVVSVFPDLSSRYVTLKGQWHFHLRQVPDLLRLVESGLDPRPLVTHVLGYDRVQEAYDLFERGETGKVVLRP